MNLRSFAFAGLVVVGIPNAILNMMFFMIALGSLSYFFGEYFGAKIAFLLAGSLGIGFVIAETLIHVRKADLRSLGERYRLPYYWGLLLVIMACLNYGAGILRSQDNVREHGNAARAEAQNDSRYRELEAERQHLEKNVLDDGFAANDQAAMARMAEIGRQKDVIVSEYIESSHTANNSRSYYFILSLAFVTINLVFGFLVDQYRSATNEVNPAQIRPQKSAQKSGTDPKKIGPVVSVAAASTPLEIRKKPAPTHGNGQGRKVCSSEKRARILRLFDLANTGHRPDLCTGGGKPKKAAIAREIGVDESIVRRVLNGDITGDPEPDPPATENEPPRIIDPNKIIRKSSLQAANAQIRRNKQERMRMLQDYLEEYPDASLTEMATAVGVSSRETVRKYLQEMRRSNQYFSQS